MRTAISEAFRKGKDKGKGKGFDEAFRKGKDKGKGKAFGKGNFQGKGPFQGKNPNAQADDILLYTRIYYYILVYTSVY